MDINDIREYKIKKKAKNIAETPWLVLPGENKESRRLAKITFVRDNNDANKFIGLHLEMLLQKRNSEEENWPAKNLDLRSVPKTFGYKFALDSIQTYELFEALKDAYPIGSDDISSGTRTILRGVGKDELVITNKNKTEVLKKISEALSSDDLNNWLKDNLSTISENLAFAKIYNEKLKVIKEFKINLTREISEEQWRKFLIANKWIFGASNISIIDERRLDIHHQTDLPFEIEGGFMDIVEIKKPTFPFWAQKRDGKVFLYRDKFLIPHHELQGATAQVSKYILQAEKHVNDAEYIKDHNNAVPLKPRGLIVHGRSSGWGEKEWEAFRLLNDELHSIQIITFDHLLERAERTLSSLEAESRKTIVVDDSTDVEEIPF